MQRQQDDDMQCAVQAGILTVKGCLGDEGQESESGELCLGTEAHSYQQEAQCDKSLITIHDYTWRQ